MKQNSGSDEKTVQRRGATSTRFDNDARAHAARDAIRLQQVVEAAQATRPGGSPAWAARLESSLQEESMFELEKYDATLHREQPAGPSMEYEPVRDVAGISFLHWGEHCVECAAPDCYSSCDLYQARSDLRCRRFTFGAYKNSQFKSFRGYGIEVSFKKWAKIEAFANPAVRPLAQVLRLERMIETAATLADGVTGAGYRMSGSGWFAQLSYIAVEKLARFIARRNANRLAPEAFLLEVYNPDPAPIGLQVIFSVSPDDSRRNGNYAPAIAPVISAFSMPPGYSRHLIEAAKFRGFLEADIPFRITMLPEGDGGGRLVFLSCDLVTFKTTRSAAQTPASKIKCVVWDLDNTIWDGTLVEGDEVTLRPGVVDLLMHFDQRGILQSIVSKNDFEPVWNKLTTLGIAEYFLYPQIDWMPKSQKVKSIAKRLNIGLDTFALIDDNPFERDEVARAISGIVTIDANQIDALSSDPRFQGSVTAESASRRKMYREEAARESDVASYGSDYLGFLRSCEIELQIAPYSEEHRERVEELVQRTNQLNFSGRKYSRAEMESVIAQPELEKVVLKCVDRYGSYGTVGFCLIRRAPERLEIVDLMLSCRVQGKFIEQALFAHLLAHHNANGSRELWVNFHRTERNTPAANVLGSLGFVECRNGGASSGGMMLRVEAPLECDFISVRCSFEPPPAVAGEATRSINS